MIICPNKIVEEKSLILSPYSKIQQSGIDISIKEIKLIIGSTSSHVFCNSPIKLPEKLKAGHYDFICHEYIKVPKNAIALIYIRSTFNRRGAFITTGVYDNGFENFIGGVLHVNLPLDIQLNERIAQIVFMKSESNTLYNGQYQIKK